MAVAATTALRPTSLASPSASTDFTPRSKSSLRTTPLAYEQRVSGAKTIGASLPFSVIFNGWFESPSANIPGPAASTCATLAPPPGAMKDGTATPSSSKNFFSLATRCWPYTKVETLCETVMGFGACARAGARQAAATAAAPEAVRKRRRGRVLRGPPFISAACGVPGGCHRRRVRRPRAGAGEGARSRGRAEPGLGARAAGRRAARGAGARRVGGAVAAPGRGARTRARRAGGAAHRGGRPAGGCAAHAARRADGRRGRRRRAGAGDGGAPRGAAARAAAHAAGRDGHRRGAHRDGGGGLGGQERRDRGAGAAARAPRRVHAAARQGRSRGPAARLLDPGAEPRGQHRGLQGRRPRDEPGRAGRQGRAGEDPRAGAKS